MLKGQQVTTIPNAIDTRVFRPMDKKETRRKMGLPEQGNIILFVSQRVTDERKGISYLIEAVKHLVADDPSLQENTSIAILGGHAEELTGKLPFPTHALGYISTMSIRW